MSAFFPESKEDFEKNINNVREFVSLQVQYALMKVGPEDSMIVECDKCRHRKIVNIGKSQGVDEVVSIIMKWVKDSELARLTLLASMADALKQDSDD